MRRKAGARNWILLHVTISVPAWGGSPPPKEELSPDPGKWLVILSLHGQS